MVQKFKICFYFLCILPIVGFSQSIGSTSYDLKEVASAPEWRVLSEDNLSIQNPMVLAPFFKELESLYHSNTGKIRITHIGDSHIQAGFVSSKARGTLQEVFGNAGLGFTFPHRLAKSNGISELRFTSSIPWDSKRNIYASEQDLVGLSGFSLQTKEKNFAIALEVQEEAYGFDVLRVFSPYSYPIFSLAKANKEVVLKNYSVVNTQHTIKSGEALSIIARKYGVSVAQIKQANKMRSDNIRAGAKLQIPIKKNVPEPIDRNAFDFVPSEETSAGFVYHFPSLTQSVWLLPNEEVETFALNGVTLERNTPGVVYDGIGVNGARFSDFNKTPLFFEQLKDLKPNLMVISLGTNEAFDQLDTDKYLESLKEFVENIRAVRPELPLLFTTPPPSLVRRSTPNAYAENYALAISEIANTYNIAVWDLYQVLGGNSNIKANYTKGLVAKDYIHYTKQGYEQIGGLLSEAILQAFHQFTSKLAD